MYFHTPPRRYLAREQPPVDAATQSTRIEDLGSGDADVHICIMTLTDESSLRVQINHIDYSVELSGPLDKSNLPRVPVIRVYGVSSTGIKTCIHVHQTYPYFFVEYIGTLTPGDGES
jgi:hypothetical protein